MPAPLARPDPASPLLSLTALQQAALIREGALRAAELVELYLGRIEALDGELGAFVHLRAAAARREAETLDRERAVGRLRGPLHGVPTGIKDLHPLRGAPLRMGSRAFSWLWSPVDDGLVAAVRRAGMPILGKTSTSELALLPVVETELHPPTRNPWRPTHSAGGSSGGAGAALAAGMLPIAPGSDGAGSIRIPAALCGVYGLKPGRGRVADGARRIDPHGLTALGPMGRCPRDLAALLDLMPRGPNAGPPATPSLDAPLPRLRIGLLLDPPVGETDPAVAERILALARRLRERGHEVQPRPRVEGRIDEFAPIYQDIFARIPVPFPRRLHPVVRDFRARGRGQDPAEIARRVRSLAARADALLDGVDLLLSPTVPRPAPPVGAFAALPPEQVFEAVSWLGAFTALSNLTGNPALSLPVGLVEGLPAGAQLVGRPGDEGRLLALAAALDGSD